MFETRIAQRVMLIYCAKLADEWVFTSEGPYKTEQTDINRPVVFAAASLSGAPNKSEAVDEAAGYVAMDEDRAPPRLLLGARRGTIGWISLSFTSEGVAPLCLLMQFGKPERKPGSLDLRSPKGSNPLQGFHVLICSKAVLTTAFALRDVI